MFVSRIFLPLVIIAEVAAGTLNCSAAYFRTAVNGASSGTFNLVKIEENTHTSKLHFERKIRVRGERDFELDFRFCCRGHS
jgi:hypothetical protein